jgi:uncharacterized damage-inducible protein DinB
MRFLSALLLTAPLLLGQMPKIDAEPATPFSLRYIDVVVGTGAVAAPGKQYTVHYTGWLRDGTQFDSSIGKKPLTFVQGRRQLIAGWETGFEGMKVGGKRRLIIPYQLAYGELGRPPRIPAKAELIFDVELLEVGEPTQLPAAVDVILPLADQEEKISKLLKAVPEDKLDWRPGPGVRSFREVFLHIAYANQLLLNIADNQPAMEVLQKQIEANTKGEHVKATKDEIQKLLTDSFAAVRKSMEAAQAPGLGRDAKVFGMATTKRGAYTFLDVHAAEHMGQLIAYCRSNGIVPPWSAGN